MANIVLISHYYLFDEFFNNLLIERVEAEEIKEEREIIIDDLEDINFGDLEKKFPNFLKYLKIWILD